MGYSYATIKNKESIPCLIDIHDEIIALKEREGRHHPGPLLPGRERFRNSPT